MSNRSNNSSSMIKRLLSLIPIVAFGYGCNESVSFKGAQSKCQLCSEASLSESASVSKQAYESVDIIEAANPELPSIMPEPSPQVPAPTPAPSPSKEPEPIPEILIPALGLRWQRSEVKLSPDISLTWQAPSFSVADITEVQIFKSADCTGSPLSFEVDAQASGKMLFRVSPLEFFSFNIVQKSNDGQMQISECSDAFELGTDLNTLSLSDFHSCKVGPESYVQCSGNNANFAVSESIEQIRSSFAAVSARAQPKIVSVATGLYHSCVLTESHQIYCWGDNAHGQLGSGNRTTLLPWAGSEISIPSVQRPIAIAAGDDHSCALLEDFTYSCWGSNRSGQIGSGTIGSDQLTPAQPRSLPNDELAVMIRAGANHTCVLSGNGKSFCWGQNGFGQLGNGQSFDTTAPQLPSGTGQIKFKTIAASGRTSCAMTLVGQLQCWGDNTHGQISSEALLSLRMPVATSIDAVSEFALGSAHLCRIRSSDRRMSCAGNNFQGELGNGTTINAPIAPVSEVNQIIPGSFQIIGGTRSNCLKNGNTMHCWGDNQVGQLGMGRISGGTLKPSMISALVTDSTSAVVRLSAGENHRCALHEDGKLGCWGKSDGWQLGVSNDGNRAKFREVFSDVINSKRIVAVESGRAHNCAVYDNRSEVVCWGANDGGQSNPFAASNNAVGPTVLQFAGIAPIADVSLGSTHSCILTNDGSAYCWGANFGRRLIANNPRPIMSADLHNLGTGIKQIQSNQTRACTLSNAGIVDCWGAIARDGSALPKMKQIAVGDQHICALDESSKLWCGGSNQHGQQGNGSVGGTVSPLPVRVATSAFRTIVAVKAGKNFTCIQDSMGLLSCWGSNASGQLGIGNTYGVLTPDGSEINFGNILGAQLQDFLPGYNDSCVITSRGVFCWGKNSDGQLGAGGFINSVPQLN
jgi:alpha-tubulin suppressor-like RCC1 family protein